MADLPLDRYIVDVLMPDLVGHDRSASGFLVYLYLWRHSHGRGRATIEASYQTIANDIGLSKTAVQTSIARLKRRRLVSSDRRHATATPVYRILRPWLDKPSAVQSSFLTSSRRGRGRRPHADCPDGRA